jgi:hypothetical protein
MAIAIGDVIRVVAKFANLADDVLNVYHVLIGGDVAPSDSAFFSELESLLDSAYTAIQSLIHQDIDLVEVACYNVTQDEFVGTCGMGTFAGGSASGKKSPPQNAALVLFNTDVLRSQGRKFLPPMATVNIQDDGTVEGASLTDIGDYAAEMLFGLSFSQGYGVFGNYNYDLTRFAEWKTARVPDFFATQRRRYAGKGA